MSKKKAIILTSIILFICCFVRIPSVQAAEPVEVVISSAQGKPGDTAEVTVSMGNNPGTTMYELNIIYDGNYLEVLSVKDGGYYPEWFEPDTTVDPLYISAGDALSLTNLKDAQNLAVIQFRIKEQAPAGELKFSVDGMFLNADLDEYTVAYKDGGCIKVIQHEDDAVAGSTEKESSAVSATEGTEPEDSASGMSGSQEGNTESTEAGQGEESGSTETGQGEESGSTEAGQSEDSESAGVGQVQASGSTEGNQKKDAEDFYDRQGEKGEKVAIAMLAFIIIGLAVILWKKYGKNETV